MSSDVTCCCECSRHAGPSALQSCKSRRPRDHDTNVRGSELPQLLTCEPGAESDDASRLDVSARLT
jgi:hypothetical protein